MTRKKIPPSIGGQSVITWLIAHPLISIHALEQKCNIPPGTIHKVTTGNRNLPEKHLKKLTKVLSEYGYNAQHS